MKKKIACSRQQHILPMFFVHKAWQHICITSDHSVLLLSTLFFSAVWFGDFSHVTMLKEALADLLQTAITRYGM